MTNDQIVTDIVAVIMSLASSGGIQWYFKQRKSPAQIAVESADRALEMADGAGEFLTRVMKTMEAEMDRREEAYRDERKWQADSIARLMSENAASREREKKCDERVEALTEEIREFKSRAERDRKRIETKVDGAVKQIQENAAEAAERGGRRKDEQHSEE